MKIGIIGLPQVGKTTIFNVLTKSDIEIQNFSRGIEANIKNIKVPDSRLENLQKIYEPKKFTPAEIEYVDIAGITSSENKQVKGLDRQLVNMIKNSDAFLHVVRAFNDENVIHVEDTIDVARDYENVDTELVLTDLDLVENKIERLEKGFKKKKPEKIEEIEYEIMKKCKEHLEEFKPLREIEFSEDDLRILNGYQLLSLKPVLVVVNIDEDQLDEAEKIEADLAEKMSMDKAFVMTMCAKIEMEISQLDDEEAQIFMDDLGITESSMTKIVQKSYDKLGLISFFTVGKDEVRAWTIKDGTKAVKAAGKIHSDIEKGFIRAELIGYEDFVGCDASMQKAKEKGLLRLEGKEYIMKDGDIVNFRFNV